MTLPNALRAPKFYRIKSCSLRGLEHDGDTFDHEGPLIINGAQIRLVVVARRVQIVLLNCNLEFTLFIDLYIF